MMLNKGKLFSLISVILVICFFMTACGDGDVKISETTTGTSESSGDTYLTESESQSDSDTSAVPSTVSVIAVNQGTNSTTSASKKNNASADSGKSNVTESKKSPVTEVVKTTVAKDPSNMSLKEIQDSLFATNDPNKAGELLELAGFEYDAKQGIYYSSMYPLQRNFGFNVLYDLAAPRTGMIYETKRILFTYGDKEWMVQLWKGQYGITVGAEIGIYNKPLSRTLPQYDCVSDEDMVEMSMTLYKDGEVYFTRGPEKHWWLTGFKVMDVTLIVDLKMDFTIAFDDTGMANAFHRSLRDQLIQSVTYERVGNKFYMSW